MPLIDADVHNAFTDSRAELRPFLPRLWQEFADRHGIAVPPAGYVSPVGVQREDARPPSGGLAGSDPDHLVRDHLDRYKIDYAILTARTSSASRPISTRTGAPRSPRPTT